MAISKRCHDLASRIGGGRVDACCWLHERPAVFPTFCSLVSLGVLRGMAWLFIHVVKLQLAGLHNPIAHLRKWIFARRKRALAAIVGVMLAGIDMLFFMWIKPEVTAVSPFWADQLYADIDKAVFGTDPWRFFQGIDLTFHAWAYSFFWAVAIMATLLWLFAQAPSRNRSAALLNYFALWSIFGPIGQYFGSAAGPIFYQKIGFGDRFVELSSNLPYVTNAVSDYLWQLHVTKTAAVGAGISAMPSLHIATVVWIYLALRSHRSRMAPAAALFAFYIFALSVALGWHYAIDGLVGALGAIVFQWISQRYLDRRQASVSFRDAAVTMG